MEDQKPRGRGRGRGRGRQRVEAGGDGSSSSVAAPSPPSSVQPPSSAASTTDMMAKMENLTLEGARGGSHGLASRKRRLRFIEPTIMENQQADKIGRAGAVMRVSTNLARFKRLPDNTTIYLYDVNFAKGPGGKCNVFTAVDRYRFFKMLQERNCLPPGGVAYDGRLMFIVNKLGEPQLEQEISDPRYGNFNLLFRLVAEIMPMTDDWFRVINVIFGLGQQLLGQRKCGLDYFVPPSNDTRNMQFSPANKPEFVPGRFCLNNQFEVLCGYSTALQRALVNNKVTTLMHISSSHRLANLRSVLDLFRSVQNDPRRGSMDLIHRSVLTRYNNKNYKVVDIQPNRSIDDKFTLSDGRSVSQREYFHDRYNINLTETNQPFVICAIKVDKMRIIRMKREGKSAEQIEAEKSRTVNIPAELCYLTGFSESEKTTFQRDKNFAMICRKDAKQRGRDVELFNKWFKSASMVQQLMNDFNIELDEAPHNVNARQLPICYRPDQLTQSGYDLGVSRIKMSRTAPLKLAVIDNDSQQNVEQFCNGIASTATKLGLSVQYVWKYSRSRSDNIPAMVMKAVKDQGAECVVVVFGRRDDYKEYKTTCIEAGIPSQVVRGRTAADGRTHVKIFIQIATKCGIAPWYLAPSALPQGYTYMVVGVDTFHSGGRSVAGCVFSLDSKMSKFYSTFHSFESGRSEFNKMLCDDFVTAIKKFCELNKSAPPNRIFLYRDGVGDNQLENVKKQEIDDVAAMLKEKYGTVAHHFVVTIVKKRIQQRFFKQTPQGYENVPPGTVVDDGVLKPNWTEYYMVPQQSRQGTATPTNYNIIHNNHTTGSLMLSLDEMQRLTFALTHLYYNWCGTIRVPAPVQYAHKLAFLLGQLSSRVRIPENIRSSLFYL